MGHPGRGVTGLLSPSLGKFSAPPVRRAPQRFAEHWGGKRQGSKGPDQRQVTPTSTSEATQRSLPAEHLPGDVFQVAQQMHISGGGSEGEVQTEREGSVRREGAQGRDFGASRWEPSAGLPRAVPNQGGAGVGTAVLSVWTWKPCEERKNLIRKCGEEFLSSRSTEQGFGGEPGGGQGLCPCFPSAPGDFAPAAPRCRGAGPAANTWVAPRQGRAKGKQRAAGLGGSLGCLISSACLLQD